MAGKTTRPYKATLSGSIGAGMGSVFNPRGRKYYILEHKVSSKYHRAGEAQEIIVDQIEIGRDSRCQVRFDDNFSTVSRRHAAIIKDGDNWKLVQISKTNTTLLNGRPVQNEWYLQNGDEIQLSVNGPKLGFIVPTGKKATVGSIGLTRRLSLFRQQALRPYKQAIVALAVILVLTIGGLGTWNYLLRGDLVQQSKLLAEEIVKNQGNKAKMDSLKNELVNSNKKIAGYEKKLDSVSSVSKTAYRIAKRTVMMPNVSNTNGKDPDIGPCADYVYFLQFGIFRNGELFAGPWIGTGFLLEGGYFVTAQHCVIPWSSVGFKKDSDGNVVVDLDSNETQLNAICNTEDLEVRMLCQSKNDNFTINYSTRNLKFKVGNAKSHQGNVTYGEQSYVINFINLPSAQDWGVIKINKSGGLPYDAALSRSLKLQTELYYLGFPRGEGAGNEISPIFSKGVVGHDKLTSDGLILSSNANTDGGHSGGPVFALKNGKYHVIGIHVGVRGSHDTKGMIVPISNAL